MSEKKRIPYQDIIISLSLIALAVVVLIAAKDIPPPFFDPIGSAAFPKYTAYLIIFLALVIGIRSILLSQLLARESKRGFKLEPLLAAYTVGIPALYVLSMNLGWASFRSATTLFIFALAALLSRFDKRVLIVSAIIATVFGFGGQYLLTEVFYMDLPQ
ncbi:MAG TPA: hypothetical protein DIV79_06810 [Opitutae bacterium]|nr:hypothetical protein [Opitutaceae bacterium]HCR29707.1 hypothetical protein [Opitutae bacterium]